MAVDTKDRINIFDIATARPVENRAEFYLERHVLDSDWEAMVIDFSGEAKKAFKDVFLGLGITLKVLRPDLFAQVGISDEILEKLDRYIQYESRKGGSLARQLDAKAWLIFGDKYHISPPSPPKTHARGVNIDETEMFFTRVTKFFAQSVSDKSSPDISWINYKDLAGEIATKDGIGFEGAYWLSLLKIAFVDTHG
ncbi:hypothetical protein A3A60_01635 [Candidatus Curtissbacteria bacterium RIFCSPLOWO2_01_FULL_42_26]|uniref:Uncharacterized protein n=1 Tax=Candidatus Curtissbacteria bacterium RIFCSPLOWO2_01_FULL_42_26 TaxID=1797729 RepID=A0A1F5HZR1_9BACT|nr:MAG: hypothetical protein A3A60_01635 [Candidatus Curtissbacteria bacterium RIFCSPLOWO2_01_FULL_42_26]